jgi:KipI family sensor histidine kinase inhibitor
MGWRALGDSAWLFEPGGGDPAARLARVLGLLAGLQETRIAEVRDIVASFETVAVHFDPADGEAVLDWLLTQPPPDGGRHSFSGRSFEIPVDYTPAAGSDIEDVARRLGIRPQEVAAIHAGADYLVAAVGFSPGFPYLLGLDPRLALPRKPIPARVPAGSVAIAGGQAGIYPNASLGGWHVLGRTDARLFDPSRQPAALLRPGDRVRFVPASTLAPSHASLAGDVHPSAADIEVIDPGVSSTIQDTGRPGHQHSGVSPGGAADWVSAAVVNHLVGNPATHAVLECAVSGPLLRFHKPQTAAWLGWRHGSGRPVAFRPGDLLDLRSRMDSMRGYLAIAGGFDVPEILGGRSTDVRAGLGGYQGRPLRAGDLIAAGVPSSPTPTAGCWQVAWPRAASTLKLRFLAGMQAAWFDAPSAELLRSTIYQTTSASDRTGIRLRGPALKLAHPRELVSQPVVRGSIQVPPNGTPIVLLSECQTIGGYPQIGHVISADLPALARALPGTPVVFEEVTLDQARHAWREIKRGLAMLRTGLSFLP